MKYMLQIMYTESNNAVEYEALLHGLRMAVSMGIQRLEVRGDSNLAMSQVNGDFDAKDPKMVAYRNAIMQLLAWFDSLEFHHIQRDSNQAADTLARLGTRREPVPKNTFLERLFKPSVKLQIGQGPVTETEGFDPGTMIPLEVEQDDDVMWGSEMDSTLR